MIESSKSSKNNLYQNFRQLVELALSDNKNIHLKPVIEKEILHYSILNYLQENQFLNQLVFMGGTSLRLCYGSHRFSEDLDFVVTNDYRTENLEKMALGLKQNLEQMYGFPVSVKTPKTMDNYAGMDEIFVDRWQITITTSPEKKDLPAQKIKLEVANVPARTKTLKPLSSNYVGINNNILIPIETKEEIFADKTLAFVVSQKYIRYRDIWDLTWLTQQKTILNPNLVVEKLGDYHIEKSNYLLCLYERQQQLKEIIHNGIFVREMQRFLDSEKLVLFKTDGFLNYLEETIREILDKMIQHLEDNHSNLSKSQTIFKM